MKKDRKKAEKIVKDLNKILNDKVHFSIDEKGKLLVSLPLFCKSQAGHRQKHKRDDDFFHGLLLKSEVK